jgi:peptidoglycan/xylan/chitin deacetylase (PgdA/CDA1 family)
MTHKSLAAIVFLIVATTAHADLQAGAAKRSIVPPFPTLLGGFIDRPGTFTGVKSPVFARALVLKNSETSIAIVATDLLNMSRALADRVRAEASKQTGIPADHMLITAAHNHSAPAGFTPGLLFGGGLNDKLVDFLATELTQSIVDANAVLAPATVGFGEGKLDTITRNRQQGNTTVIDPQVGVLRVQKADSRDMIAILFNFTGHPVILGSDNMMVCGEYPGMAETTVEETIGGVALFTQGACGDITMQRSGDPYLEVERLGRILASEVIKTAEQIRPSAASVKLASRLEETPVEPRKYLSPEDSTAALATAKKAFEDAKTANAPTEELNKLERKADELEWTDRFTQFRAKHPADFPDVTDALVHVLQVGPLIVVGIPGEMFVEYALEMKGRVQKGKGMPMMLAGYSNDYVGYIVTPQAVKTGGYEQATTRLDASAGRAMTEAAMTWVNEMVEAPAQTETATKTFAWPTGKKLAISLSFDDGRATQPERGQPILDKYGVKATFYVLPSAVRTNLDAWTKVAAAGHEIANHTDTHPCSGNFEFSRKNALENYTLVRIGEEMERCTAQLQSLLGVTTRNFAYPCGQTFVGSGRNTQSYVPVVAGKFVTGRGYMGEAVCDPMFVDMAQLFGVNFDGMTTEQAMAWVDKARKQSAWLVLAGHDIGASGHQVVLEDTIAKLCEYAQDPKNEVWIDTVANIADYVVAKRSGK